MSSVKDACVVCPQCNNGLRWISVKDRMPKKGRRVLIMAQEMDGTWDDIFIGALRYENTDDWDIEALDCCSVAWFNNPVITHWMPLPRNAEGLE